MTFFVTRTSGDVVSEMLMSRTAFNGSFLVVEGSNDIKFWRPRVVGQKECQFVLAGSKHAVTTAVNRMNVLGQGGFLGVVDDDLDSLLGYPVSSVNLIRTETRDIETLMLSSGAFERIIHEIGDAAKVEALERREGHTVREAFMSRALLFGELRYLNALNNWLVSFDNFSPWRFADVASWSFDRVRILSEFVKQVPKLKLVDIETQLAQLTYASPWSVIHGKDGLNVLAVGVRSCIGGQQYSADRIHQLLRLAFEDVLFRATRLYSDAKDWELLNCPYRVLAA